MHPTMDQFLNWLEAEDRARSAETYRSGLGLLHQYLTDNNINPLEATLDDLRGFQRWLSEDYRQRNGKRLARITRNTRLAAMRSYYRWAVRRGLILVDPSKKIVMSRIPRGDVKRDHLEQQEVIALIQTQAGYVERLRRRQASIWSREHRNLAWLCMAIATGRRVTSLRNIKVQDLNFRLNEIRVEREKGKAGRVLPCAAWAMAVAKEHIKDARKALLDGRDDEGWLFVGIEQPQMLNATPRRFVSRLKGRAARENPDLEQLAEKHLTPHGLRVTFATMLFLNGANIRSINELMLHTELSTTARYTPIPLEELRRACRRAHPRA